MTADTDRVKLTLGSCMGKPQVLHNGLPVRVVLERKELHIGCTDITLEAAEYLITEHRKRYFPNDPPVVLQDGCHPC